MTTSIDNSPASDDGPDVFTRQGFGHSTGLGKKPGVVVVDFTYSFVDPDQFGGGNIADAVAATARLLVAAREAGWPIAYSRVVFADNGSNGGPFARKVPALLTQTESAHGSQIVEDLAPARNDLVVRKTVASAFFRTELDAWLRERQVDTVIVTGATTSGCVRATAIDAVSYGYATIVPSDCVGDRAMEPHRASLFDLSQKYADVVASDVLIKAATATASKDISHG